MLSFQSLTVTKESIILSPYFLPQIQIAVCIGIRRIFAWNDIDLYENTKHILNIARLGLPLKQRRTETRQWNKFSLTMLQILKKTWCCFLKSYCTKQDNQIVSYTWCFASHKASCCLYTSGCLTRKQKNSSKYPDNKLNLGLKLKSNLLLNKLDIVWKNKLPSHGNFHSRDLQNKLNTTLVKVFLT